MDWSTLRAHTAARNGKQDFLAHHLLRVAQLAQDFASAFGSGDLAYSIGLLHDIGKAIPEFQEYLCALERGDCVRRGPPHAIWGAVIGYRLTAHERPQERWKELALPVAGHHGGLTSPGLLSLTLDKFSSTQPATVRELAEALSRLDAWRKTGLPRARHGTSRELAIRMVASALTDADYCATEEHFRPEKSRNRGGWPTLDSLDSRFTEAQHQFLRNVERPDSTINSVRSEVYHSCVNAAPLAPGFFRLTVPTGGGKTRSGLAFALAHARRHSLRRVIFAVPYTTITDQTAHDYRGVLGSNAVLEHHSQAPWLDDESASEEMTRSRLAAENWDAPVIVTTTVQLFESLFASRPGRIRKLHNVVGAVIVLDEVQTLPTELLEPTLDVLRTLVDEYGCSVVLCTATQPAFDSTPYLRHLGDLAVREIVAEPNRHFEALRRVDFELKSQPVTWTDLGNELGTTSVLVVLNTRRDALALLDEIGPAPHVFHLSTLLCGQHRKRVVAEIKKRLRAKQLVQAVCTQVVEAGVDIDFPAVYRALAPLDRIVQAAGRCNREGLLAQPGRVVIFDAANGSAPRGAYAKGTSIARMLLSRNGAASLYEPNLYTEYFQRLYSYENLDARGIQEFRSALDFPETASRYYFIQPTVPVLVPYADAMARWHACEHARSREAWRALHPFLVNLFTWDVKRLEPLLDPLGNGMYLWLGKYDAVRGIVTDAVDPSDLNIQSGERNGEVE